LRFDPAPRLLLLPRGDLLRNLNDLVDRLGHVPIAIVERIVGKRLGIARTQIPVAHDVQRDLRRWRQQQRIEMDVFTSFLPSTDDGDFLFDDILGGQRIVRHEQDKNVARVKLTLDLQTPIRAAGHQAVGPDVDRAATSFTVS
jgi:hypothetical protein